MTEELRRHAVLLAALAAALAVGGWQLLGPAAAGERSTPRAEIALAGPGTEAASDRNGRRRTTGPAVVVHVAGAVRRPGVYRLRPGARVHDAVTRAGGATRAADTAQINLAAKVEDGRQVLVPRKAPPGASAIAGSRPDGVVVPVNLNTATLEQLDALDGIGPTLGQRILDYREAHGGFESVEELREVEGIGDKRFESLRAAVDP